jgi:hypothetical protein
MRHALADRKYAYRIAGEHLNVRDNLEDLDGDEMIL